MDTQKIMDAIRRICPNNVKKQVMLLLILGLWIKKSKGMLAQDGAKWITIHPRGKKKDGSEGEKGKGVPVLIDDESGRILGGMGGKFNYQKVNKIGKEKHVPHFIKKRLAEYNGEFEEPKVQPEAGSVGTSTGLNKQKEAQEKVNKAQKAIKEAQEKLDKLNANKPIDMDWLSQQSGEYQKKGIEKILPKGYSIKEARDRYGLRGFNILDSQGNKQLYIHSLFENTFDIKDYRYQERTYAKQNTSIMSEIKNVKKGLKKEDSNFKIMFDQLYLFQLETAKQKLEPLVQYEKEITEAQNNLKNANNNYKYIQNKQRRAGLTFDSVNVSSSIATKIPQDTKTVYDEAIRQNAPIHIQQFIADRIGNVRVDNIHCKTTAFFTQGAGIEFDINNERGLSNFFHETGHAMDYDPNTKTHLSNTWCNGKFKNSLKQDLDMLIEKRIKDYNTLSTNEYMAKHKIEARHLWGFKEAIMQEIYSLSCNHETKSAIADMIFMSSKGQYGDGHLKMYAKDSEKTTTEAFAELTEIYCLRPHEIEVVKKYFPTAVADYNEMIKEM